MSWRYSVLGTLYMFLICAEIFTSESVYTIEFLLVVSSAAEFNTSGVIPAVDLSLQRVNNCSLPFILSYNTTLDSQCDYDHSLQVLQDAQRQASSSLVAIIGCGCSTATEAVADIPELLDLPVISYASSSASFNDETKYPNMFRTIPDSMDVLPAIATFIDFVEWRQALVLTQEILAKEKQFNITFEQHNVTTEVRTLSNADLYKEQLLESTSQRIFVLDVNIFAAQYYLCQAYWSRKYYPGYAWIIVDNFAQWDWWKIDNSGAPASINCTQSQFEIALNYSITVTPLPAGYNEEISRSIKFSKYAYDAVGSLALALNRTAYHAPINNSTTCDTALLINEFSHVHFSGTSGMVAFDSYGNRANSNVQFLQQRKIEGNFTTVTVAVYSDEHIVMLGNESLSTIWPDGVPSDGIPVVALSQIHYAVLGLGIGYALLGIMFSIGFLIFNTRYRNTSLVRLTSPRLNYIIILGALTLYATIVLYTIPSFNSTIAEVLCESRTSSFALGYNLCISVTLVKLWRVYYIFKNPRPNKKVPKDKHLVLIAILIIAPDFILNLTFALLNVVLNHSILILNRERPPQINDTTGEVTEFYFWTCERNTVNSLDGTLLLVYKFGLHVAALFFVFSTRKIKLSALNDYKANSAIVYVETAVILSIVVSLSILADYPTLFALMASTIIFIGSTFFLCLTFIPKMVALYKDPKGENVFNADRQFQEELKQQNINNAVEMDKSNDTLNIS